MLNPLPAAHQWSRDWLFNKSLPLWWERGADHRRGGFHESLDHDGNPVGAPTRVRVQARQAYVFAEAGRMGWEGPWRAAMHHGLDFMLTRYGRSDGLFGARADQPEAAYDLYDQAFVLFALAHAHRAEPTSPEWLREALSLVGRMNALLKHPLAGYEEAYPPALPLRSNPHMHLLEACFAWIEAGVENPFKLMAQEIWSLALSKMIDPRSGAVGEYFDRNWHPFAGEQGSLREPGHQFEWSYLFYHGGLLLGSDAGEAVERLERFGARNGVDAERNVAVFSVDARGMLLDGRARLWAQTERLRTYAVLARSALVANRESLLVAAGESFSTLQRFLGTDTEGLWWEWMDEAGNFVEQPSPATSLYHLVTAMSELNSGAVAATSAGGSPQ